MAEHYEYEKYDPETGKRSYLPMNDLEGKITGHIVIGMRAWFDENPEERKKLGWIKHIHPDTKDIQYNKQSQYLISTVKQIDEYTVTDEYHVMDKSEEMMLFEELAATTGLAVMYGYVEHDGNGGIVYGNY